MNLAMQMLFIRRALGIWP